MAPGASTGLSAELKLLGLALDEVMHQGRNIFSSLPERRDRDGKNIEPEPEVFAKSPGGDHLLKISVCGRYNADVHRYGSCSSHAFDFFGLKDAQQPHLGLGWKLSNLIQEDRALVGPFESPSLLTDGPGESSLLVTEELAVEEGLRDGAAVHLDQRPILAG